MFEKFINQNDEASRQKRYSKISFMASFGRNKFIDLADHQVWVRQHEPVAAASHFHRATLGRLRDALEKLVVVEHRVLLSAKLALTKTQGSSIS